MGWNGSLTADSAIGASITYTPGTSSEGAYTVDRFTAPKKGVYRFTLKGSGGTVGYPADKAPGGTGGKTDGYLLLDKGQTVVVSAGGTCSAAYVCQIPHEGYDVSQFVTLGYVTPSLLYFVAGAGGGGATGSYNKKNDECSAGGNGGGSTGGNSSPGGYGGTQSAGGSHGGASYDGKYPTSGSYGTGGNPGSDNKGVTGCLGGRGGDGYYGGGGGCANAGTDYTRRYGGGGGSGYVKTGTLTVNGKTYTSTTTQGGGAASNAIGSVQVTYYARAELPIRFDGSVVERLVFNGTEITRLVYNETVLFIQRLRKRRKAAMA